MYSIKSNLLTRIVEFGDGDVACVVVFVEWSCKYLKAYFW